MTTETVTPAEARKALDSARFLLGVVVERSLQVKQDYAGDPYMVGQFIARATSHIWGDPLAQSFDDLAMVISGMGSHRTYVGEEITPWLGNR